MTRRLSVFLFLLLPWTAAAQSPEIRYTLSIDDPVSHLYRIEIEIAGIRTRDIDVAMPAWSPGVYVIRDFARNVQQFEAANRQGRPLQWEQLDKQTWRISKAAADDVRVRYRIYSTALTDEMADVAPASVFMYVVGQTHIPVSVEYEPDGGWRVHTGLERRGGRYHAPNYDVFAGTPAFLGEFKVIDIRGADEVPYRIVFSNPRIQMTELQVQTDLEDLVNAAAAVFGGAPFRDYTFLVKVQPSPGASYIGYFNSSRLTVGENDFVNQNGYLGFMAAAARSLVKAWSGNLVRPASMSPYDFSREAYSRLFWFTEGAAAYTADMLLLRTGVMIPEEYYIRASSEIDALQHQGGRQLASLEDASWNVWTPTDNPNAAFSYVLKGKIAASLIDAEIRGVTGGQRSLEDVLRHLAAEYAAGGAGVPEDGLIRAIERATSVNVSELFDQVVRGRGEIDYNRHLEKIGLRVTAAKAPLTISFGIEFERIEPNQARIRRVLPGSAAEAARLDGGDILVAMDSERVTYDNLVSRIRSKQIGRPVVLSIMRGERLLTIDLTPQQTQTETWSLGTLLTSSPEQVRLRELWLGDEKLRRR